MGYGKMLIEHSLAQAVALNFLATNRLKYVQELGLFSRMKTRIGRTYPCFHSL
ncbi:hypothetical protein HMPREF0322_04609 [Desulfitobacterium hafniense DP7]|uniref:Uncharacterized protein n=1 Tax=Desulfitobacterium hafniense DP7 TaxID=537010 RepID=G9XUF0_DESHA|nr:hypothetical protein HMPREF0322_04609 [Desulfitobacterium hafniense DP7]